MTINATTATNDDNGDNVDRGETRVGSTSLHTGTRVLANNRSHRGHRLTRA
jgi:hypothetical protein